MSTGILSLLVVVLTLVSLSALFLSVRLYTLVNTLTKGLDRKDLVSSLETLIKHQKSENSQLDTLSQEFNEFVASTKSYNQKLGFKRFNPFKDTGGNQSFILCLTDAEGNGVVISSLHSRENTRVYAKPLTRGQSPEQTLSKEEMTVIRDTLKSK